MFRACVCFFYAWAMVTALTLPVAGQSVICARSGVIHFFEGSVYLDGHLLEQHPGKFQMLAQGGDLRVAQGSAEVLLTPGVFLRIGEKSAIRMVANNLADTRVELLAGSAIVASEEPASHTSVTLICRNWNVHFLRAGTYRIDSEPPRLWVDQGKAEVSAKDTEAPVSVGQGMELPFAAVLAPEQSINEPADKLSDWSEGRSQSISADNAIAAEISDDPTLAGQSDSGPEALTYFPLLGVPPPGLDSSSPDISSAPYQPGFNSIYLPGYTYQPFMFLLGVGGYSGFLPGIGISPRGGISPLGGISPRGGIPFPRPALPRPAGSRPPFPRATVPAVPRSLGGFHGIHR